MSELRNLMMAAANGGGDIPEGFELDRYINAATYEQSEPARFIISPTFDVNGSDSISFYFGMTASNVAFSVFVFDEDMKYVYDYQSRINERTQVLPANARKIRFVMNYLRLDDCYIKNNTTGEYYFKGKNVQ